MDWIETNLKDLVEIKTGKKDANEGDENGAYRFYTCARDYSYIKDYAFDGEAILISGNGAYVGYVHYFNGKFDAYQRTYVLSDFKVDVFFLFHYLRENLKLRIHKEKQDGATPYIKKGTLSKFKIKYPENPAEQTAIATILSKVDEAIEATRHSIKAAEKLKKALMQNLLTGKLKPDGSWRTDDEFYEDEKFGKYPKDWSFSRFKDYAVLQRGKDLTDKAVVEGIYPVVKSNGVQIHHSQYFVEPPGVVTGRSGTIGKVFYIEEKFWSHNTSLYVKDFKRNNPRYIYYLIHRMNFRRYYAGTTVPTLNRNDIHRVKISIPKTFDEQERIASKIDEYDKLLKSKQTKIRTLQRLKKSLMQNLLTGKIRLDVEAINKIISEQ